MHPDNYLALPVLAGRAILCVQSHQYWQYGLAV